MRWWRSKRRLRSTIPGRLGGQRVKKCPMVKCSVFHNSVWQDTEALFPRCYRNKRLEDDQSAIAYNLVAVNAICVIAAVETALTVYQALFRSRLQTLLIDFSHNCKVGTITFTSVSKTRALGHKDVYLTRSGPDRCLQTPSSESGLGWPLWIHQVERDAAGGEPKSSTTTNNSCMC